MTIAIGERFVREHNAARASTANTTAADISYDTAVINDSDYSWSSPEVTVDTAGNYLCIFDIGQVQLTGGTRAVGTLVPSVNTTDQTYYKATHRYLRDSGGNHGASFGAAVLQLSASDDVKVRNPATGATGTDAILNYGTNASYGGGIQLLYLGDGDITEVQRQTSLTISYTAGTTTPWTDSTGTWTQITFTNEIIDDGGLYSGTGGDITLEADKKYLIVYGGSFNGSSGQRHSHLSRLEIDGTNVQVVSAYERNASSDNPPMSGLYLHEVGGTSETLKVYGTVEHEDSGVSNTVTCSTYYLQVIELPDSAEWIHADNGATDSLTTALAGVSTWYDTPLSSTFRSDGDSNLSLDGTNNAIQNDSGASLPVLAIGWHRWDRDVASNAVRKQPWTRWDNGGTNEAYGVGGAFSRGLQGNDSTRLAAYSCAALLDLANTADLSLQVNEPAAAANEDMGIYASNSRYFLGVQVLNLESLAVTELTPAITNVEDEDLEVGETAVVITGTDFDTEGANSRVRIDSSSAGTGTSTTQTDTSWSDTSIEFTVSLGSLSYGQNYVFVRNHADENENATGYEVNLFQSLSTTSLNDSTIYDTQTGVIVNGTNLGSSQGSSEVYLCDSSDGSGTNVAQTVTTWTSTAVTFTVDKGALSLGTVYVIVARYQSSQGDSAERFTNSQTATLGVVPANPTISNVEDETVVVGEEDVLIEGTDFLTPQSTGKVELCPSSTYGSAVGQTVDSWSATEIEFTVVQGALSLGTVYMFITNSSSLRNTTGYALTLQAAASDEGLYVESSFQATVTSTGLITTAFMIKDE